MNNKKDTDLISFGGMILGGLAIVTFGFLVYCVASSQGKDTQIVVNESGKLQEIEMGN